MYKILAGLLIAQSVFGTGSVTLLSEREWIGDYHENLSVVKEKYYGGDIHARTLAPSGQGFLKKQTYGTAGYWIHVQPSFTPFQCEITKQVCMVDSGQGCNNQTRRYLIQGDGVLDDNQALMAVFVYQNAGNVQSKSHVFMDKCGGPWLDNHSIGIVRVA